MGVLRNCSTSMTEYVKEGGVSTGLLLLARRKRAVEVGVGEERRLAGSCGESFLNEGSEQCRPLSGSCSSAHITKK